MEYRELLAEVVVGTHARAGPQFAPDHVSGDLLNDLDVEARSVDWAVWLNMLGPPSPLGDKNEQ